MEIEVKRVKSEIHSHDSMVFFWMKWIKVQNEHIQKKKKTPSMTATRIFRFVSTEQIGVVYGEYKEIRDLFIEERNIILF